VAFWTNYGPRGFVTLENLGHQSISNETLNVFSLGLYHVALSAADTRAEEYPP
jgi:hypothetical protein